MRVSGQPSGRRSEGSKGLDRRSVTEALWVRLTRAVAYYGGTSGEPPTPAKGLRTPRASVVTSGYMPLGLAASRYVYRRLAIREGRDVRADFGVAYDTYAAQTPRRDREPACFVGPARSAAPVEAARIACPLAAEPLGDTA
jgi:hypothetical protein